METIVVISFYGRYSFKISVHTWFFVENEGWETHLLQFSISPFKVLTYLLFQEK